MKVFLINLAKNPEWMAYVDGQFNELGGFIKYENGV